MLILWFSVFFWKFKHQQFFWGINKYYTGMAGLMKTLCERKALGRKSLNRNWIHEYIILYNFFKDWNLAEWDNSTASFEVLSRLCDGFMYGNTMKVIKKLLTSSFNNPEKSTTSLVIKIYKKCSKSFFHSLCS